MCWTSARPFPPGMNLRLRSAGGAGGHAALYTDNPRQRTYPVKICVVPSEQYGDRYACVKVEVSQEKPVRYELGMTSQEDLEEELGEDDYFLALA